MAGLQKAWFVGRHIEFHVDINEIAWWSMLHCDGNPWKHGRVLETTFISALGSCYYYSGP